PRPPSGYASGAPPPGEELDAKGVGHASGVRRAGIWHSADLGPEADPAGGGPSRGRTHPGADPAGGGPRPPPQPPGPAEGRRAPGGRWRTPSGMRLGGAEAGPPVEPRIALRAGSARGTAGGMAPCRSAPAQDTVQARNLAHLGQPSPTSAQYPSGRAFGFIRQASVPAPQPTSAHRSTSNVMHARAAVGIETARPANAPTADDHVGSCPASSTTASASSSERTTSSTSRRLAA